MQTEDNPASDLGHVAEIYIKIRNPENKPRVDVLNFIEDNYFKRLLEKNMIYTEYKRDDIIAAEEKMNLIIEGEDIEERMDRIADAKQIIKYAYRDEVNLAMGFGNEKKEYKSYPSSSTVHKYFIFVRNDVETFEAIPVDNFYEMLPAPKKEFTNIVALEDAEQIFQETMAPYTGEKIERKKKVKEGTIPFKKNKGFRKPRRSEEEVLEEKDGDDSESEGEKDYGSDPDEDRDEDERDSDETDTTDEEGGEKKRKKEEESDDEVCERRLSTDEDSF